MPRILKYQLFEHTKQHVTTYPGRVLTVQLQNGQPMMWVLVEEEDRLIERLVWQICTGVAFDVEGADYIATIFHEPGLVLHVFVKEAEPIAKN